VRRLLGERFDFAQLEQVAAFARERNIGMHLDGARIFIESAYTGVPVRDYAACFDTVYVCLYKCFGAGSGAVLCGSRPLIEEAAAVRNLFGARLFKSWPYAAVALNLARGFEARFAEAKTKAERFFGRVNDSALFRVEPLRNGTNVFRLYIAGESPRAGRRLSERYSLVVVRFTNDYAILRVNETWNRMDEDVLFQRMKRAIVRNARASDARPLRAMPGIV
jgi:threonine aldolase